MKTLVRFLLFMLPFQSIAQIPPGEYLQRRQQILQLLKTDEAMLIKSTAFSGWTNGFSPDADFQYLTGQQARNAFLLLAGKHITLNGKTYRSVLFTSDPERSKAFIVHPADTVLSLTESGKILAGLMIATLYASDTARLETTDWFSNTLTRKPVDFAGREWEVKSSAPLTASLREAKSPAEVSLISKALNITAEGLRNVMKHAIAGMYEYELQALIEYEYTRHGSFQKAFGSIIGSGLHALEPHYGANTRQTIDGDMVVMDVGAKYQYYSADITRTIPVNGKFTQAQREVYQLVLDVQKAVIDTVRPGMTIDELNRITRSLFDRTGYTKYFIHGVSHHIGLGTHDVWATKELKPNAVITIEPGLYFPPDGTDFPAEYRGIGVRIEDTVLVTAEGGMVLSGKVPKEIDEIEKLMNE